MEITLGEIAEAVTAVSAMGAWVSSCVLGKRTAKKVENVHIAINSRMDELIEFNRQEATAIEKKRSEVARK